MAKPRGRPFLPGNKMAGSRKGIPNKTPVEDSITEAVQRGGTPEVWEELFKSAQDQAKRGRPALLLGLLEYAARAKPRGVEVSGGEGKSVEVTLKLSEQHGS